MHEPGLFAIPPAVFGAAHLAEVIDVEDPDRQARVRLRLLSCDGVDEQDGPIWARVVAPFAGASRGAFMIPDVGDEVLVVFLNGDPRLPLVLGGLWNGSATPPEQLPGSRVDRWTMVGKAGTRIAIVEESGGQEQIKLSTPGGVSCLLTDQGSKVEITAGQNTITMDSSGVTVQTRGTFKVTASKIDLSAGSVKVNAMTTQVTNLLQTDITRTTTTISSTYTPGAGNIW